MTEEQQDTSTAASDDQAPAKKKNTRKSGSKAAGRGGRKKSTAKQTDKGRKGSGKAAAKSGKGKKETAGSPVVKLLINADEPEECRVALLEDGKLESFHIETVASEQTKGNIYKGRVVSVEKNLQAVFVDFGTEKNGFLPFSEIHPEYYSDQSLIDRHWKDLDIKEVIKEGQVMLVEVVKETTGNKGAALTTYLSLPGRYIVLMPGSDSHGISRQIDAREERDKLREMLAACNIPEGVGYIIRTAAKGVTKTALTKDVKFQIKLWKEIKKKGQALPAPSLIYREQDVIGRFLRDHFSPDIQEIVTDNQEAYEQVTSFLELLPAAQRKKTSARLHKGPRPLLNSHNIEEQIEQIFRPTVKLPSGGSIVINPTEALVAVDVNSGSTGGKEKNFEDTIFTTNMEAAEELARQLRLRDLGGLIVVDFIDMRSNAHTREVEKKLKASMKRDKAKVDFTRISKFGLMQISRQRMGAPVQAGNYITCPHCRGRGVVRSVENQALAVLRQIQTGVTRRNVISVRCRLPLEVSQYLLNKKRAELAEMEQRYHATIIVDGDQALHPAEAMIEFDKK